MIEKTPKYRFEFLEHTADQRVVAWGDSLEECFESAAAAMFSLAVDLSTVPAQQRWEVKVGAPSVEELLARWLKDLLFFAERDSAVFSEFQITSLELSPWKLEGAAWGAPYSESTQRRGAAVKAVTYQDLKVEAVGDGWRAEVTFDV